MAELFDRPLSRSNMRWQLNCALQEGNQRMSLRSPGPGSRAVRPPLIPALFTFALVPFAHGFDVRAFPFDGTRLHRWNRLVGDAVAWARFEIQRDSASRFIGFERPAIAAHHDE